MRYTRALLTGATSGLGKELANQLASRRIPLLLTARSPHALEELAETLRPLTSVHCYPADLGIPAERRSLLLALQEEPPDLIINNAGFGLYGEALKHTTSSQLEILEVNANAILEITLESARAMRKKEIQGTILNVSSAASFFAYPSFCVYAAAKNFVTQFSQGFDAEMAPHGIRILVACPGQIRTSFRHRASKGFPQKENFFTMSPKKAAGCILGQIDRLQPLYVFDWRYRIALFCSRFLIPKKILQKRLKATIDARIEH